MGRWDRSELQAAHDRFIAVANECGRSGDWRAWTELFTPDASYVEHHFGIFNGRQEILDWITETMQTWPNSTMTSFPHEWCVCDEARGWWLCRVLNRMADPGDGQIYEEANITILHYAGGGLFSYEEDVYNPAAFGPMISSWVEAKRSRAE